MEILVTGGGGLLGHHTIDALLARGDDVRVLALEGENVSRLEALGVAIYRGDVRDAESLIKPTHGVDGILHLAGMMGLWRPVADYRAVNATGTLNVCRAAQAASVGRIVCVSSWTVYGMRQPFPCREDDRLAPFGEPYALTKAEGDHIVRYLIHHDGLPAVIVRPGTFFGPGDRLHFGRIADRLRARRSLLVGRGNNFLPFVYVTDVVQGLLLALDHPNAVGQAFNITNDQPLTQKELFTAVAHAVGAPRPRIHAPFHALYAAGAGAERIAMMTHSEKQPPLTRLGVMLFGNSNRHSIDKARTMLGYEPGMPLRVGIQIAAEWYNTRFEEFGWTPSRTPKTPVA
jgi:nucleoside-diphosphate-sugar epimerase